MSKKKNKEQLENEITNSYENIESNNKTSKKKKGKKKKSKSYIGKVLEHKENTPILLLLIFELLGAFILDILRIIKNLILSLLVICIVIGIAICIIGWTKIKPIYEEYEQFAEEAVNNSTEDTFKLDESTFIYDKDGKLLTKLKGNQDSEYLEYDDIPVDVVNAFIAVEDRSYWDNPGIDVKGLLRVVVNAIETKGDEVHGASTITQQLARNVFLTHEVSLERKAKEMLIAFKLTEKYSKQDIMEFYVNDICYGNAFYGIQAASKGYFNKEVSDLSLSEIAYLCAIPNSPSYYDPYKNPDRAITRRDKILGDMLEEGYITDDEYNTAVKEEIVIEKPVYEFNDYQSTFAIDCATKYFMQLNGFEFKYKFDNMTEYNSYKHDYSVAFDEAKNQLYTGGYKVYTTLDSDIQTKMQNILDDKLSFDTEVNEDTGIYELQGAITVVDNSDGKVIAVVGGRSQDENSNIYSLNRAYQSYRQPGSTIKPLVVYTQALENGYTPNTTVYNIDIDKAKEKGVDVQSLKGTSMTLRKALEQSKNGVAWQIFNKFGADKSLSYLNTMKFSSICPDDYYDSSSLGGLTYGVTTVEMAGAYSTLENHGFYREPTCISRILDSSNKNIYTDSDEIKVYTAKASDTMTDMMTGVLTKGTASKLKWYSETDMVAACKTGTTNDNKDGWLCGYTPYYTVAVWVGYDTPRVLSNLYGNSYPGEIWKESMLSLISDKEVITEFEVADYEELGENDNNLSISDDIPEYAYETYLPGRSDDEELSSNYYVRDYRKDRVIGESVDSIINKIKDLNKNSSTYKDDLESLYNQGCNLIDSIYSTKYTKEKQSDLDSVYKAYK